MMKRIFALLLAVLLAFCSVHADDEIQKVPKKLDGIGKVSRYKIGDNIYVGTNKADTGKRKISCGSVKNRLAVGYWLLAVGIFHSYLCPSAAGHGCYNEKHEQKNIYTGTKSQNCA
jgi:hypothetical protein